jgi:hypothetical protein
MMKAYQYIFVDEYPSSSDPDTTYTVYIRLDNRIATQAERVQSAILSCSCKGWCILRVPGGTDADRSCRHTRAEANTLARFKANGGTLAPSSAVASSASSGSTAAPQITQPVAGMVFDAPLPTKRSRWAGLLVLKS